MGKRLLAALGGNALLRRGEPLEAAVQRDNVRRAAAALAELTRDYDLVVTHGNGPQVGLLALQAAAYPDVAPYPLDVLGAESEGMIGYLLGQSLRNALPGREVATLLTQAVVDRHDPAFARPTKPIGPVYEEPEALRLATERGWTVAPDGDRFRRVVASPEPLAIVELPTIERLVAAGVVVVCGGGGGIPVVSNGSGELGGVEAVIDKDLFSALLATGLGADLLLMLTDVAAVERGWGTPAAEPIRRTTPVELRRLGFASGSMGPKVDAACRFVEATGGVAGIGALEDAAAIAAGEAGTLIVPAG
ncbi:MAG TPA: carbamate kinase [Gaiellaceae bacterium]|nr:carbamate kinase [Gaiellaceae bacterium]